MRAIALAVAAALSPVGPTGASATQEPSPRPSDAPPDGSVWLDSLDLTKATTRRMPRRGQPPTPMMLDGAARPHGWPASANGELWIDLKGAASRFVALVGVDDARKTGVG